MKKLLMVLMIAALTALVGCGGEVEEEPAPTPVPNCGAFDFSS